jgi:Flp pilus assembly protein TadG
MKRSNKFGFRRSWLGVRRTSARLRREAGAALFELALVLPLLSMLLVGIIYGGMTFYNYVVLADAVAAGARTLAIKQEAGASSATNQNACQLAQATVQAAEHYLNQSTLPLATVTFTGTSTCDALVENDTGVVSAAYPCNLPIPFTNINLCPVPPGAISATLPSGTITVGNCPYTYCISSTTVVRIE